MNRFIVEELAILAWGASVQRARIYRQGLGQGTEDARSFRREILEFISSTLLPQYKQPVAESGHYKNIDQLIEYASRRGQKVLGDSGYKYGAAQKLLNLTLKYHWCLGAVHEPPHCPVDRIVIEKTSFRGSLNWTQIVERAGYQKVIEAVEVLARKDRLSIARWELANYSRR